MLTAARVELFMPGVQILVEGDNVAELMVVVAGEVAMGHSGNLLGAAGDGRRISIVTYTGGGNDGAQRSMSNTGGFGGT